MQHQPYNLALSSQFLIEQGRAASQSYRLFGMSKPCFRHLLMSSLHSANPQVYRKCELRSHVLLPIPYFLERMGQKSHIVALRLCQLQYFQQRDGLRFPLTTQVLDTAVLPDQSPHSVMITSIISLFSTLLSSFISPFKLARKTLLWLVVSTPLKNISQLGLLFPIYGKKMFPTTNQFFVGFLSIPLSQQQKMPTSRISLAGWFNPWKIPI